MVVNEKQIEFIISVIEASKKTQGEIASGAGVSTPTLSRLMKHHHATKYTVDLLAAYFEVGEKVAELGGNEYQSSCPLVAGVANELKRLEGVYAEREARLQEQCDERVASVKAQMDLLQLHHNQALAKRDETYARSTEYLKSHVDEMRKERTALRAMLDAESKRANDLERKRNNVFWGMLAVVIMLLVIMAIMTIVDAPEIGMGWG
jgi:transcriptional regulator with XRE-family HTH domain